MRRALFMSLCVVGVGCVTARTYRLDPEVRPARAPESVVVFEQAPEQPYTVIARVESQTNTVFDSFDDLRVKIRDRAAQLGGDAHDRDDPFREEEAGRRSHRLPVIEVLRATAAAGCDS